MWWVISCLFLTVDPWVLSFEVLYVCHCYGHASGIKRLPERPNHWHKHEQRLYKSRIHTDVEIKSRASLCEDVVISFLAMRSAAVSHAVSLNLLTHRQCHVSPLPHIPEDTVTPRWTYLTQVSEQFVLWQMAFCWKNEIIEYWKGSWVLLLPCGDFYSIAIDWLVVVALCWAFCFFPFEQFAKPVVRIFLFVELISHCFFILFFTL